MKNRTRADESGAGRGGQNTVGRYVVKRHGKDREFRRNTPILYFFLLCAALAFGLFFGWIDFAGLAPLVAAQHTFNG